MTDTYNWISERLFSFSFFLLSKGITAIRFAEHQRCYIRAQTKKLPAAAEVEAEDAELLVLLASSLSAVFFRTSERGPAEAAVMHIVGSTTQILSLSILSSRSVKN